ncbi:MAG: DUF4175 family protein [Luteolibacter sp.]
MANAKDMTIEEQLRNTWKRERRFCHLRGIGRSVVWLAAIILLGWFIDWALLFKTRMPLAVSVILGLTGTGTLGWVVWRDWLRHLRPYNATRIALEVEAKHPELMSALVSYTELESMSRQNQASPELLGAMRDFAVGKSQQLKFSDIIDFAQIRKLLAFASIVLLVVGALGIRWSDHFAALFKRMAGIDSSYPLRTRLVGISGDMLLPFGEKAGIAATAAGVIPDDAILFIRPADGAGAWNELPMEKLANGASFRRTLDAPERDMRYFVTAGDCRSAEFLISVVRAPRITHAEVTLDFPGYLGRPPETSDQLNLEVPEGTRLRWRLTTDKPVGALAVLHGGKQLAADVGGGGMELSFALTADEKFSYSFEWTEGGSGRNFRFGDVEYSVRVMPDALPRIAFEGAPSSGLATVGKKVSIDWMAQDDHGLGEVSLVYEVTVAEGSGEDVDKVGKGRVALAPAAGRASAGDGFAWALAEHIPTLAPGQRISYHLEAMDLRPAEPGERVARSPVRQLSIVTTEEYMDWFRRELATRNDAVQAAFLSQREVSKEIKSLLTTPEGTK